MRGRFNDASKEAVRQKAEARRQREAAEAAARQAAQEREAKIRKVLVAPPKSLAERRVERLLDEARQRDPSLFKILSAVKAVAPRLIEDTMVQGLQQLSKLPLLREPDTWKPQGKGRETLFRSLCEHLFAKFPMPPFLWSAFFEDDAEQFALFVAFVAGGGSVYEGVKTGLLQVPLTRKMCHDLMQTPSDIGFFKAIRRVEVRAFGGDPRFLAAWMSSQAGRRLHTPADEAFWVTVIEWFSKNPMVDPNQIGPLVDYIIYRRRQQVDFSMKGRALLALFRGMEEWHGHLAKEKAIHGTSFKPTGWKPFEQTKGYRTKEGNHIQETWRVEELLTSKALGEEGRVLSHCVYSYAWSIEKGQTSIWSMNLESPETEGKEKRMTIELRNDLRRIVQFRGKFNRQATSREFQVLTDWAHLNGLEVSLGRWG